MICWVLIPHILTKLGWFSTLSCWLCNGYTSERGFILHKRTILSPCGLKGTVSSRSVTENNTPRDKVISPLLMHKWASNFQWLCSSLTDSMPCWNSALIVTKWVGSFGFGFLIIIIIIIQMICSAHISTLLGAQGANPETPGQAPPLSRWVSWVLLRALHNTRDLQLYVPSEVRSNYG